VAADARSPRDGKYIEQVGSYDPTRDPAAINVDHDKALKWLKNGAQPSTTVKSILRYAGVNLKYVLHRQGKDQETIDSIYNRWLEEKQSKVSSKIERLAAAKGDEAAKRLVAERKVREARAAAILAKNAPPVEEVEEVVVAEEAVVEAEAPAAEPEVPAAETKAPATEPEAPAAEAGE
jgi:small subunit ribosomal protein S16